MGELPAPSRVLFRDAVTRAAWQRKPSKGNYILDALATDDALSDVGM